MFDDWGKRDAREMPEHFFFGALSIDYTTAAKADTSKQDFTVCPRYWYVEVTFHCARCGEAFVFSAEEQRFWYEDLGFYVDSCAKHCPTCRRQIRELNALRQDAAALRRDADVVNKQRLISVIDALDEGGVVLSAKMANTRRVLAKQIERRQKVDGLG